MAEKLKFGIFEVFLADLDADSIVIGSGAGGLCAGVALSRSGQKVIVLEQHYTPGGWCHNFTMDGFSFCPGVHYVGRLHEDGETRILYEGLGAGDGLSFFEQNPAGYEHCIVDDLRFDYPNNLGLMSANLQAAFPKERRGIADYMQILQHMVTELPRIFEIDGVKDILTMPYRTRHLGRFGLFSLQKVLEHRIRDPRIRAILAVQCGDQGMPPSKTAMILHAGLARHYEFGGFYPMGGGGAIAWSLVRSLKRAGGKIKLGARVRRILTEPNGRSRRLRTVGVELQDGTVLSCRNVISNADPQKTFINLVGEEKLSFFLKKRLAKTTYSLSSLSLFLAVDANPRDFGLDSGNIWYSKSADLDAVFRDAQSKQIYDRAEFDALFISAPTLKDPTGYTGKGHTIEMVTFVGFETFRRFQDSKSGERSSEYLKFKEKITKMFLHSLERLVPGIAKHIVFSELGTPLSNVHYIDSTLGSVYGTEKILKQIGPFAFRNRTEIDGLYLAGASTLSHGVSGAGMSGVQAAATILGISRDEILKVDSTTPRVQTFSAEDQTMWPLWLKEKLKCPLNKINETTPYPSSEGFDERPSLNP